VERKDGWATAAGALGVVAAAAMLLGAGGAFLGLAPSAPAFRVFGLGFLLGLVALLLSLVGLWRTRARESRPGRGRAWVGLAAGLAAAAILARTAAVSLGLPAINDITTDPDDPPRFEAARELAGEDTTYPGESFARRQEAAYPDLAPIRLDAPPARALERAERAARELGWAVVDVEPEAGRLEAYDTSTIFRFVDDVVVRVRAAPEGGSRVDVRSRSRDGQGDLGANARRIRALRRALVEEPG